MLFKKMINRRDFSIAASLALGSSASLGQSQASAFPSKTVSLVVPFPPGGAVDQSGRAIAQSLFKVWKQPVVISTKAGAGGALSPRRP